MKERHHIYIELYPNADIKGGYDTQALEKAHT